MKLIDKWKKMQEIGSGVDVPWHVMRVIDCKKLYVDVNYVSIADNGDMVAPEEARVAVDWVVDQLGGKVRWLK
jgi:lysozyme family protein